MSARAVLRDLLADRGVGHPDAAGLLDLAWPEIAAEIPRAALTYALRDCLWATLRAGVDPRLLCAYDLGRSSGSGRGSGRLIFGGLRARGQIPILRGSVLLELRSPRSLRGADAPSPFGREGAYWRLLIDL